MMKNRLDGCGYNERLFSGGLRSRLHLARFRWFQQVIKRHRIQTGQVLELGCFDGKLLDFLPQLPKRYLGIDANWEGGLDLARTRWAGQDGISFQQAERPEDLRLAKGERFGLAVAMETLEHIPPERVEDYLGLIAEHLDGYLLVTVPNEKGLVFLAKWLFKRLLSKDAGQYTVSEVVWASLGRLERVARNEHKGFDYALLQQQIGRHFELLEMTGLPFSRLPCWSGFGVGIVARLKGQ